ncbi:MAG: periplasmic heavy metal sensor [Magnetococcales bacterium]|nr:periplasmic heavy metal sensor [Magnetococcales bacterium]
MILDRQRRLLIVLFLSLLINCFLGGWLVATNFRKDTMVGPRHLPGGPMMMGYGMLRMETGENPRAMAVLERNESRIHTAYGEVHAAQKKVRDALTGEPWDAPTLTASLGELRRTTHESQELLHRILVETAAFMTPQERERLAAPRGHSMGRGRGGMRRGAACSSRAERSE